MDKKEFSRRRKKLMAVMDDVSIAIIPTAPARQRNRDIEYAYRPDSDFYYLTGFDEPEAVAVLMPGREQGEFLLFCRERNPERERWDGARVGLEGACDMFGADDAFPIGDIDDILPGLMENRSTVFFAMGYYAEFDHRMLNWVSQLRTRSRSGINSPGEFVALDHVLHDMRLYKSRAEVRALSRAMELSASAHQRAMRNCRPGMYEYQIEAELVHEFRAGGSRYEAYPSIVAGGKNACVLHYIRNSEPLRDGDLLLIDAGAEIDCYASDITRTFPVGGRFSKPQKQLYEIVLAAQLAAIDKVRPGNHWNEAHEAAIEVLVQGLVDLGILKGKVRALINTEKYLAYCPHRTGHWLGLDVHDVGDYKIDGEWRVLEPGMVLTVEPGLYIPSGDKTVARRWRGIGIRIEDDVLVTKSGPKVLTSAVPKEIDQIEALMGHA